MRQRKHIVMIGTRSDACGGIASVISLYERNGLFRRRDVVYLPTHCNGQKIEKGKLLFAAGMRLLQLLVRQRVLLLHVHVASNASFWRKSLFLMMARAWNVPTVLHLHAGPFPLFYSERCNAPAKYIVRQVLSRVSTVLVVSNALNRWVRSICTPKSVVTLFNPSVLVTDCHYSCKRPREAATILFLGNLGKAKGTYDLLHAMSRVANTVPEAKLMLCGDGETGKTRELIRQLSLEHCVQLPGWIDQQRRAELLASASLFVLPSYAEGLPMSILEAMGAGLPVIATRVGGVPDAISHEREGLLVEPGDIDQLAASIVRLLKNPDERRRLAEAAHSAVRENFGPDRTIAPLEALYDALQQQPGHGILATEGGASNSGARRDADRT